MRLGVCLFVFFSGARAQSVFSLFTQQSLRPSPSPPEGRRQAVWVNVADRWLWRASSPRQQRELMLHLAPRVSFCCFSNCWWTGFRNFFPFSFYYFFLLPLFSFWIFPTELRAQMLQLLSSEVVLDSFFFFFPVIMIFIIISLPGQMIWKVLCCIFCVSFAFWMWEPTWYQWGCAGGGVLDAAVALKTGCVCFVFCLFVSSETAELHIPLLSVPRCLIPPQFASWGLRVSSLLEMHQCH